MTKPSKRIILKYSFLQLPGILLLAVVLFTASDLIDFPKSIAVIILAIWVLKDIAIFPFVWKSYDSYSIHGTESLRGRKGIAVITSSKELRVKIGMESWKAESADRLSHGDEVEVTGSNGIILTVKSLTF